MSQQLVLDYLFDEVANALTFIHQACATGSVVRVSMMGSTADPQWGRPEQWAVRIEGPLALAALADPVGFVLPPGPTPEAPPAP